MYCNTILKLDLIIIIIQKYCEKYLKPGKDIDIKKSKTIKFVLEQINDIKKTKDFKTLKSIFIIKKNYKIEDLKDWLSILCANKPQLFSKHFKLDVEIDLTKSYKTYVNLLSKLENNKTKCDLKTSTKKISILFNLLFYDVIVGGVLPKIYKKTKKNDFSSFFLLKKEKLKKEIFKKEKLKKKKLLESLLDDYKYDKIENSNRWRDWTWEHIIYDNMNLKNGPGHAKKFRNNKQMIEVLFPSSKHKRYQTFLGMVYLLKSLKETVIRPYNKIYPLVQQSHLGSCWINSILVALMYCYKLNELLEILIIEQSKIQIGKKQNSLARIIPEKLLELLILQYKHNGKMKSKECILLESFFVRDFITLLTNTEPDVFSSFSEVIKKTKDTDLNDIILNEGGTYSDIFKFIRILLELGLGFTFRLDSTFNLQFYSKTVNKKKITICVTEKKLSENYKAKIESLNGFKFASIILSNYYDPNDIDDLEVFMDKEEEEEKVGHVITVVTDNNDKEYFYNGWMTENCANPLQIVENVEDPIYIESDDDPLKFSFSLSRGIMILFKEETFS